MRHRGAAAGTPWRDRRAAPARMARPGSPNRGRGAGARGALAGIVAGVSGGPRVTIALFAACAVAFAVAAVLTRDRGGAAVAFAIVAAICVAIAAGYGLAWRRRSRLE